MLNSFAYRRSPIWVQESFISAKFSLRRMMREGRAFEAIAARADKSQWWSEHELREFQSRKLRIIVGSAARHVPYYRDKYRPLDLNLERLELPEGMSKLPSITKPDVREG